MPRLSTTLSLYLARQFLVSFLTALAVVLGLILLFDVIELLRRTAGKGADLSMVLTMGLLKLPQMMNMVLPFAVMIGGMASFWRLTRSAELVVARAAGVSVWQFLTPIMGVAALAAILNVMAVNPLAAHMYGRYERMLDSLLIRDNSPLSVGEGGLWLREVSEQGERVLHAGLVRQDGLTLKLRDVSIFHFREQDVFTHRTDASEGVLSAGRIELARAWEMKPGLPSEFHERLALPTSLTLNTIQDNFASPEAISFWDLPGFIQFYEDAGFSARRQKLYLQSLWASPLLLCSMVLIAAVFTLAPNLRSGGLMWRIVGGVATGFLFYFFSRLVYALGMSSSLPVALAAWSPALVMGMIGTAVLFHNEDG